MKVFFLKSMDLFLVAVCLFCYQNYIKNRQETNYKEKEQQAENLFLYKDGVYQGSGEGFGGSIVVQVIVSDGRLSEIEILSADGETKDYLEQAGKLAEEIVEKQSAEIDAVSGATYSSHGILDAVGAALEEAQNE